MTKITTIDGMTWVHEIPGEQTYGPYNPVVADAKRGTAWLSGVVSPDKPDCEPQTFREEAAAVVDKLLRTVGHLAVGPERIAMVRVITSEPTADNFVTFNEVYRGALRSAYEQRGLPEDIFPARTAHESGLPTTAISARLEMWAEVSLPAGWTPEMIGTEPPLPVIK